MKGLFLSALLLFCFNVQGGESENRSYDLAVAATSTGAQTGVQLLGEGKTFQARGTTSAGAGAVTVDIEANNFAVGASDGDWVVLCTISLTLSTTTSSDGCVSEGQWRYVRANVKSISGTDASVDVKAAR